MGELDGMVGEGDWDVVLEIGDWGLGWGCGIGDWGLGWGCGIGGWDWDGVVVLGIGTKFLRWAKNGELE